MQMRLGFSVAAHIDPEILLVDEALSVGDLSFQDKCMEKMTKFKKSGTTILIVSHDMSAIDEICDRAAWIEAGSIMKIGDPREVVKSYASHLGHKVTVDTEEQPSGETEMQTSEDEAGMSQDSGDTLEEVSGSAVSQETGRNAQKTSPPYSWWDSPVIILQCEALITGDPAISFYEFLNREYSITNLQRGLSICNKLRGLEDNFIENHICKSFDVINVPEVITSGMAGTMDLKENHYDLFLCVDYLNRIENLDVFLKDIGKALKEDGIIIAMEYIGPARFQWTAKEIGITDTIYGALTGRSALSTFSELPSLNIFPHEHGSRVADTVNPENVIPMLQELFDILDVRYFGGPFYDLLLNKMLHRLDQENEKDVILIKTIIQYEQILIKENILENAYAMIIAKKNNKAVG
jgi:SAM-dependent methyltransferase